MIKERFLPGMINVTQITLNLPSGVKKARMAGLKYQPGN